MSFMETTLYLATWYIIGVIIVLGACVGVEISYHRYKQRINEKFKENGA